MKSLSVYLAGWLLCLLFCVSCAVDQHFEFPKGPEGKSAYEVWVEYIRNNGDPSWEGGTDMPDFFLYLKGDPGEAGQNPDFTPPPPQRDEKKNRGG
jgi:hypothetical protein